MVNFCFQIEWLNANIGKVDMSYPIEERNKIQLKTKEKVIIRHSW